MEPGTGVEVPVQSSQRNGVGRSAESINQGRPDIYPNSPNHHPASTNEQGRNQRSSKVGKTDVVLRKAQITTNHRDVVIDNLHRKDKRDIQAKRAHSVSAKQEVSQNGCHSKSACTMKTKFSVSASTLFKSDHRMNLPSVLDQLDVSLEQEKTNSEIPNIIPRCFKSSVYEYHRGKKDGGSSDHSLNRSPDKATVLSPQKSITFPDALQEAPMKVKKQDSGLGISSDQSDSDTSSMAVVNRDFIKRISAEMSVNFGEKVTILCKHSDNQREGATGDAIDAPADLLTDNLWLVERVVKNAEQLQGLVPSTHLTPLHALPPTHAARHDVTRDEADQMLSQVGTASGTYLVRPSSGKFVLFLSFRFVVDIDTLSDVFIREHYTFQQAN